MCVCETSATVSFVTADINFVFHDCFSYNFIIFVHVCFECGSLERLLFFFSLFFKLFFLLKIDVTATSFVAASDNPACALLASLVTNNRGTVPWTCLQARLLIQ